MRVEIQREHHNDSLQKELVSYDVAFEGITLLELLTHIKTNIDHTLTFTSGCRSSVCGSCAMRVNDKEVLACSYKVQDGDVITPLNNMKVVRDLVVDNTQAMQFTQASHAWAEIDKTKTITQKDAEINALQSDCILCGSCYSACPVYSVNDTFKGPFALTRVWRYVSDARESDEGVKDKIETIQNSGIWDCTLCNECVPVCPQNIAPKQDISMLRSKSGIFGFMDPNFANSFGGGFDSTFNTTFDGSPDFGGGFS